ncbi:MAG: sigma-54 interaction domain-containing protein [Bacillota bacterium]
MLAFDLVKKYPYFDRKKNEYCGEILDHYTVIPHVKDGLYIGIEYKRKDRSKMMNISPLVLEQEIEQIKVIDDIFYYPVVEKRGAELFYLGMVSLTNLFRYIQKKVKELDAVIDSSYDGIYISTPEGKNLRANDAIERLTGIKKEFFVGKSLNQLVSEGIFNDVVTAKVVSRKKVYSTIQRINTGKETLVTGSPVFDEKGDLYRVITNVRDVSELTHLKNELEAKEREKARLENELKQIHASSLNEKLIFQSSSMHKVSKIISEISSLDVSTLITGESGVGKEVVAEQIHKLSDRSLTGGFLKINCAAIPKDLIESELFGYEEGAFTGAKKGGKVGLFEAADKGTIFLDEIGDLPLDMQAKLLRVLQNLEFNRIGSYKIIKTDTRVIAATNKELIQLVEEGKFRKDLFFRLNIIPIEIKPLRERKEDINVLAFHFLDKFNKKYKKNVNLPLEVLSLLKNFHWPGNVRELSNLIERYVVLSGEKAIITDYVSLADYSVINTENIIDLKKEVNYFEQKIIMDALNKEKSSYKAAIKLGVSQSYISRRLKKIKANN